MSLGSSLSESPAKVDNSRVWTVSTLEEVRMTSSLGLLRIPVLYLHNPYRCHYESASTAPSTLAHLTNVLVIRSIC